MRLTSRLAIAICASVLAAGDLAALPGGTGLQRGVVFTAYSPLTRSVELARRMLTPLSYRKLLRAAAEPGRGLREQPVDLAHERFTMYVPTGPPPAGGYGVLVFVPPWSAPVLPPGWSTPLD